MVYKGYETSKDYGLLKVLLDEGYKIIGFANGILVTLEKANENWSPDVSYGLSGDDLSRNCHKSENFFKWCNEYKIEWLPQNKKKHIMNIFNKFKTICDECGGESSLEPISEENGHTIYACKYCGKQYISL